VLEAGRYLHRESGLLVEGLVGERGVFIEHAVFLFTIFKGLLRLNV